MSVPLSRIDFRDLESVVLSYQQSAIRSSRNSRREPQGAAGQHSISPRTGSWAGPSPPHRRHRLTHLPYASP